MTMRTEFPKESNTIIAIGTDDMRKRMGEILDCVNLRGDEFIIERKHYPLAVLIPVQKHKALTMMARKLALDMLNHKDSNASQEEVDALTDSAKHHSRKMNK
jgi:hypothetical protein